MEADLLENAKKKQQVRVCRAQPMPRKNLIGSRQLEVNRKCCFLYGGQAGAYRI